MLQAAGPAPRKDEGAARDRVVRNRCFNPRAAYVVDCDGTDLMVYDHAIRQLA